MSHLPLSKQWSDTEMNTDNWEEHSPYCERDIRRPANLKTIDEKGSSISTLKGRLYLSIHLRDASVWRDRVGWKSLSMGFVDSRFRTNHRTCSFTPTNPSDFWGNYVICSFVPRMYDYHPAIPVPTNHSNVDSDEVLYYVDGDFMSRKSVTRGMITLHRVEFRTGPHPGTVEKGIGKTETKRISCDDWYLQTFVGHWRCCKIIKGDYYKSWLVTDIFCKIRGHFSMK